MHLPTPTSYLSTLLLLPLLSTAYILPSPFSTTTTTSNTNTNTNTTTTGFTIPSIHDSAIQARRILHLERIGTLSTNFPLSSPQTPSSHQQQSPLQEHNNIFENRPQGLEGLPIGLMDYISDCEPSTGNPTLLALSIATTFKNVAAGSNITLSVRWHPPSTWRSGKYGAASLPRFSLVGYLEALTDAEIREQEVADCFTKYHPDAVAWLPGNRIHESRWVRLVVREVYWIGGFGDRAYIGWIPLEVWGNVTREEVEGIRLPGETSGFWW